MQYVLWICHEAYMKSLFERTQNPRITNNKSGKNSLLSLMFPEQSKSLSYSDCLIGNGSGSSAVSINAKHLHLVSLRASGHPHPPAASMNYVEIAVLFLGGRLECLVAVEGWGKWSSNSCWPQNTSLPTKHTCTYTWGSGFHFSFLVERVERSWPCPVLRHSPWQLYVLKLWYGTRTASQFSPNGSWLLPDLPGICEQTLLLPAATLNVINLHKGFLGKALLIIFVVLCFRKLKT